MATGSLAPAFWFTALSDAGVPLNGALLYFYLSGSGTPATVYHDAAMTTPWSFPAVTDSAGRIVVYLDASMGALKLILTDANGVPVGPTVDPITPTNAGVGLGVTYDFNANSAASVINTSYVSGAGFDKCHPGSSPWNVNPGTLAGAYVLEFTGVQVTSGTLTLAVVNLTDGAPDTPIATATVTSLTGATARSSAITFPASGSARDFGIKAKVSANSGYIIGARIVKTA